jgi:shikimate 5-dehydrogenase
LHAGIKDVRIATDSYCSKNYARLLAKGVEIQNEGNKRGTRVTLSFAEQVAKTFDTLDGKAKLMGSKEIENKVVEDRYKRAVMAFNRVWNKED